MERHRSVLLIALVLTVCLFPAHWAGAEPFPQPAAEIGFGFETYLCPAAAPGEPGAAVLDELDEFTDSISYYSTFEGSYVYFTGGGPLYGQLKFTPLANFQLEGLTALIRNPQNFEGMTVYVYEHNVQTNQPGELLFQTNVDADPGIINNVGYFEFQFNPADYLTFSAGTNFWICWHEPNVFTWQVVLDNDGGSGDHNRYSTSDPGGVGTQIPYDWFVSAGGTYLDPIPDVSVISVFNDIQRFHLTSEQPVQFFARATNVGHAITVTGQMGFEVRDGAGDLVFTSVAALPPVAPGDTVVIAATDLWSSPVILDRYVAEATADVQDDFNPFNDTAFLQQQGRSKRQVQLRRWRL